MTTVGIIANPAAGKDIRRLVAHGRVVPDHEKVNILTRVMIGLEATGVEMLLVMPDLAMLGKSALNQFDGDIPSQIVDMPMYNSDRDSSLSAQIMVDMGAMCLVTLGGDGTNRAVAKGAGRVPIVPISTGTNNVFPVMSEGTVSGMAAGVVASGAVELAKVSTPSPLLGVRVENDYEDIALIDVAVTTDRFLGARAVWDIDRVKELFLSGSRDDSIGLASIGARLRPDPKDRLVHCGMHIRLGPGGTTVSAPIAPGMIIPVDVRNWSDLLVGESVEIDTSQGTLALDGERSMATQKGGSAVVRLRNDGPVVVSVERSLREATSAGVFTRTQNPQSLITT